MSLYSDANAELRSLILTTWPDILDAALFNSLEEARVNWIEQIEKGTRTLPFAVLHLGEKVECEEFSIDAECYYIPCTIARFVRATATCQPELEASLETLRKAIDNGAFTNFQAVRRGSVDTSENNVAGTVLIDSVTSSAIAGTLTYEEGILVGDYG